MSQFGEVEGVEPFAELVSPDNPQRSRISICPFDENFQPGKQYSLVLMLDLETEVEMKLPGRFKVSPQIAGAIKAVAGVVDVQTL